MSKPEIMLNFLAWWTNSDETRLLCDEEWFSSSFIFDTGVELMDLDALRERAHNSARHSDVSVLRVVASDDAGAVFFEATEEISLLRLRVGWLFVFDADKVGRIFQTHTIILQGRSSADTQGNAKNGLRGCVP